MSNIFFQGGEVTGLPYTLAFWNLSQNHFRWTILVSGFNLETQISVVLILASGELPVLWHHLKLVFLTTLFQSSNWSSSCSALSTVDSFIGACLLSQGMSAFLIPHTGSSPYWDFCPPETSMIAGVSTMPAIDTLCRSFILTNCFKCLRSCLMLDNFISLTDLWSRSW